MKPIFISVVIPAWNAALTLTETLDSIAHQSRLPDEVIVVDDGSTDETLAVARAHPMGCRVLHQVQGGPAKAANLGWQAATGNWVAFLDSDDLWTADWLANVEQTIASQALDLVLGSMQTFLDASVTKEEASSLRYQQQAKQAFLVGCSVFKKQTLIDLNGFDESFQTGFFIELFDRFQRSEHVYCHAIGGGLLRRIRKNSLSWRAGSKALNQNSPMAQDFLKIARQAIAAKRK
jgi:glycosyltransferase involved in cell wall biosynthesis